MKTELEQAITGAQQLIEKTEARIYHTDHHEALKREPLLYPSLSYVKEVLAAAKRTAELAKENERLTAQHELNCRELLNQYTFIQKLKTNIAELSSQSADPNEHRTQ